MYPRHAARFFLAVYLLWQPCAVHAEPQCAIDPNSIVSDASTSYSALEALNSDISPSLHDLTQNTDFFAYYRLNLYNKVCPFWTDESSICGNRACAVDTIEDEDNIPPIWRTEELSKLEGARAKHPGLELRKERPKKRPLQYQLGADVDESCVLEDDDECDERDYCVPEDEGAAAKGDYVSLVNNTERFTGYSGEGAWQVWDAIYKENCFSTKVPHATAGSKSAVGSKAAQSLWSVIYQYGRQHVDDENDIQTVDDGCLEQRAFYRIISGMHASISSHICWDYFNQTTGEWVRNVQCYRDRLHDHPERISNLYFNYALVTRAITKLRKHLEHYTFCSGDPEQDFETKQKVLELADRAATAPHTFDETAMFQNPAVLDLKDDFKVRFRNVSRLMDCVGCDKCRLWGKVQTAGYGAALKVLFEFDESKNGENPHLRRTELVALVNTLGRISHSLSVVQKFRDAVSTGDYSELGLESPRAEGVEIPMPHADEVEIPSPHAEEVEISRPPVEEAEIPATTNAGVESEVVQHVEDDNFDGLDNDPYNPEPKFPQHTLSEEIWSEVDLVWRAYKMVLTSWIEMPFKLSAIFIMEMNRLWNFWLGLPVPPRSWDFHFPSRDEL